MKILQVTKYYYPAFGWGGPVQVTYNLSKYLVKRGHEVTVYAGDSLSPNSAQRITPEKQIIDGAEVHFFPIAARLFEMLITPNIIPALWRHIREFDIVHLHEFRSFQNIAFLLTRSRSGPYVLQTHGMKLPEHALLEEKPLLVAARRAYHRTFGEKLLRCASKVLIWTNSERKLLQETGVETSRIVAVPNGVSPEDFRNSSVENLFEDRDVKTILYVGRINKSKGIETLVRAFHLLTKRRTDVRLAIVGPDDGYLNMLQENVKSLKLENKVLFTGLVSHRQKLGAYNQADIVVYPGTYEGFPIVPLEAAIMGRPIVVSDDPGMSYVKEGKFGLTFPYGNENRLEIALETLLEDGNLARELGKIGKKCVLENYTWGAVTKTVERLYKECCADN